MKKLRLDVEALAVESFPTTPADGSGRGTVHGREETAPSFCGVQTCLYECDTWGCDPNPGSWGGECNTIDRMCVSKYGSNCTVSASGGFQCSRFTNDACCNPYTGIDRCGTATLTTTSV